MLPLPLAAETVRLATWHAELTRDGPGLLLRDILSGEDPQVAAVIDTVADAAPDILLLTGLDWDNDGAALAALSERLASAGADYPHRYAPRPNAGMATGLDLDGDGRRGTARDAQGYGRFTGEGAMALLSRWPYAPAGIRDLTAVLWRDLPGASLALPDGSALLSEEVLAVQRLSSTGHWSVPVATPFGLLTLLAFSATPPVFDGPEDRNGRRNHDEILFWARYLDGAFGPPPKGPVAVIGNANLDPRDGDGRHAAIRALLSHPRLQDPVPSSPAGRARAEAQGGVNTGHRGDPAHDTADWDDAAGPGNLRVSYILPESGLVVAASGIRWVSGGGDTGLRHGLVWVDLILKGAP